MNIVLEFESWEELISWKQNEGAHGEPLHPQVPEDISAAQSAEPEPEPKPAEPDPAPAEPAVPAYTLDVIAGAMADLIDQGQDKMVQIEGAIQKYGVPAINELDPASYDAFAEDLKALGAKL